MAAKPEPPVLSIEGIVLETRIHNASTDDDRWLAVGIELDGHTHEVTLAAPADLAPTLHAGARVALDVRVR